MKLYVVRHAHAGDRAAWDGDDRRRPLSKKGRRQAAGIADALRHAGVGRLVSSPATRCVQTLEPLGDALGLDVELDERLAEGAAVSDALDLVERACDRDGPGGGGGAGGVVVCSHGDVIPDLLRALRDLGARIDDPLLWPKASTWVVGFAGDRWTTGTYLAPPGKD